MLTIRYSARFKKDYKLVKKRGYNIGLLEEVLEILCSGQLLPQKYRDHVLTGNYDGQRECHINPDWLLIYKIENDELLLSLTRTGTHSDLF
ncbi:MAG TPA: type II toxin-antitoxin system mRNA interferase toxin, RelE/StbE family [Clostridiales bacterium]|nr:type II toxin-antitoxin system YafQ family toxin [Clostridia bacterium]MDD4680533.1 type II toxin-antitoxin system YafQ family toxin [Clostridia bacterium]HCS76083.1 type II toxin-antitoxin system mRNA interferase toxin, RelE/StbE family [Clostridiales bacterium]